MANKLPPTKNKIKTKVSKKITETVMKIKSDAKIAEPVTKGKGRPKIHETATDRVKAFRERKVGEGRRLDIYLPAQASWRLSSLAQVWECSRSKAIERLIMEADKEYSDILFPETLS